MVDTLAVVSGGLDSVTMLYWLREDYGHDVDVISFDYGQRHVRELTAAGWHARQLGLRHDVVSMEDLGTLLASGGSTLVDHTTTVPEGHYAAENMAATVVPNRNMIMASIAAGVAIARGASSIALAVHAGDHAIYPDCRPGFWEAFAEAVLIGNETSLAVSTPFIGMTKAEIVKVADGLQVPVAKTWSCYRGGARHCGRCGTCVERAEAFHAAGVTDPTEYVDPKFWQTVTPGRNPTQ